MWTVQYLEKPAREVFFNKETGECNCQCRSNEMQEGVACKHIFAIIGKLPFQVKNALLEDSEKLKMIFHKSYFIQNLRDSFSSSIINYDIGNAVEIDNTLGPITSATCNTGKRFRSGFERHEVKNDNQKGVMVSSTSNKRSKKNGGDVGDRKCSKCGSVTHDIRNCPFENCSQVEIAQARSDVQQNMSKKLLYKYHRVPIGVSAAIQPTVPRESFLGSQETRTVHQSSTLSAISYPINEIVVAVDNTAASLTHAIVDAVDYIGSSTSANAGTWQLSEGLNENAASPVLEEGIYYEDIFGSGEQDELQAKRSKTMDLWEMAVECLQNFLLGISDDD
jgi:hypothetical protein